jgi:hypothetical protein
MAKRSDLWWKALTLAGGAAAAAATDRLVELVWKKVTDTKPPLDRLPGSTTRRREIVWVLASGIALAMVRLVALRLLARVWRATTGRYPKPLVESSQDGKPDLALRAHS